MQIQCLPTTPIRVETKSHQNITGKKTHILFPSSILEDCHAKHQILNAAEHIQNNGNNLGRLYKICPQKIVVSFQRKSRQLNPRNLKYKMGKY